VVRPDEPLVVLTEPGTEQEVKVRLARIGFDELVGVVADPYQVLVEHPDEVEVSSRISAEALSARLADPALGIQLVDVRNPGEVQLGIIDGATVIPLPRLRDRLGELDPDRPVVVHCAGGYRSSVAASLLAANGFADVSDLLGGYAGWAACATATP
jgi:hydroxyacylglutathione hydrolase